MSNCAPGIRDAKSVAKPPEIPLHEDGPTVSSLEKTRKLNKLKQDFTGAQDTSAVVEALEFAMQCFQTSQGGHAKHLHLLSAGILVQVISTASPKQMPAEIVASIYASLAQALAVQKNDAATSLTHLRLLHVTLTKSSKMPAKGVLQEIAVRLKDCMCLGHASQISESKYQPRDRLVVSSPMNTFMLPVAPTTSRARKAVRKRGSNSSLSSARSETSESESSSGASQAVDQATIRFEALKCLASLAQVDSRALHPHWPIFLDISGPSLFTLMRSDHAPSVRDMAVQACRHMLNRSKGYLALAKEATTKSAFTSLSENLANIALRLNQLVTEEIIAVAFLALPIDSKNHWLELTDAVLANTPYDHLQRVSLSSLIRALLSICNSEDTVKSAALPVIARATSISAGNENLRKDTSEVVLSGIKAVLAVLQARPISAPRHWAILAALSSRLSDDGQLLSAACDLIRSSFPTSDSDSRLQSVKILCTASSQPTQNPQTDLIKATEAILQQVQFVSMNTAFTVGLASLVGQNAKFLDWNSEAIIANVTWLIASLVLDKYKANRCIAYNCIAAILQSDAVCKKQMFSHELLETLIRQSVSDPAQAGKAEAIWSLANVCDSSRAMETHLQSVPSILSLAASAAGLTGGSRDVETIRISAIRILGVIFSSHAFSCDKDRMSGVRILLGALNDASAKIQWNTATSLKRILAAAPHEDVQSIVVDGVLGALRGSENVKVCSSSVGVLGCASGLAKYNDIKETLRQVKQKLATLDDLPFEEFARAEQTQIAIQNLIDRISGEMAEAR